MYSGGALANLIQAKRDGSERRRLHRHSGTGLIARMGDSVAEVLDISLGGVRLAFVRDLGRGELQFRIVKASPLGEGPDYRRLGAPATAVVVARGEHDLHLRFVGMNYPLAQLIIAHIAAVSGVSPYIFR